MISEDYVSFDTAKLLKSKGFNAFVTSFYEEDGSPSAELYASRETDWNVTEELYSRPTLQRAAKWLRKKHNLFIQIEVGVTDDVFWYDFDIIPVGTDNVIFPEDDGIVTYAEPEEALEAAIKYCLEKLI